MVDSKQNTMNFPDIEKEIIKRWYSIQAFEKSVKKRPKDKSFVFYEGPPTANGKPGFHHVEARAYKDVICRYKTMRGYRVERRAGWDTHGLPVEVEVEKELGISNKKEIEDYGIEKFNEKCRRSVWRYQKDWEYLTERMGFWIDMENPYITYKPLYMESLWWVLKQAHEKGLLYEGHKVMPYCPRCGTALSSHEVAQGYKDVTDDSVFAKFQITNSKSQINSKLQIPKNSKVYLLAWTTTPWTLPGNVALAVGSDIKYSLVKQGSEYYILASDVVAETMEDGYEIIQELQGKDIEGAEYEPLFNALKDEEGEKYKVVPADFVSTDEGTGIVHTAVMYGEDDYKLGEEHNMPKVHTVDKNGRFTEKVKEFEGQFVKDAELAIINRLKAENQLYKVTEYEHSYPHCWRCDTPLLYYAMNSWFIAMSKLRSDMINANRGINWVPEHLKEGRFGQWLEDVKDWAVSRSRYWGTPLPVWRCRECGKKEVVGSRKDISRLSSARNKYWLLRHGMAEHTKKGVLSTEYPEKKKKFNLTNEGRRQVKKAAKELKDKGGVDLIVSSPMTRTKQTAEIVAEELGAEVKYDKNLLEVNVGIFEGSPGEDYRNYFTGYIERFTKKPPQGENLAQVQRRYLKALNSLEKKYRDKKILIVGHGDPLLLLESALTGLTVEEAAERRQKNYPHVGKLRSVNYAAFPYNKEGNLDFHRPYVDKLVFDCPDCGTENSMQRVEDLVDVWFDSGAMPFAQQHYPFENKAKIEGDKSGKATGSGYPADYIAEAIDQTRGWFYTLLAVSAVLDKAPSYKNVITLGIVLDEKGQKMSKSKGNIVDPLDLAEKYGMDAVRLYFFTVNQPADVKRFTEKDVKEKMHKFIATLFNSHKFLKTYAPGVKPPQAFESQNILDKWVYARLKEVSGTIKQSMDNFDVLRAARALESFVLDDFSNWYIRRSRERLQRPGDKKEKEEASKTLAYVLNEITKLASPFTPFVSEYVWQDLNKISAKSVHWEEFTEFKKPTKSELNNLNLMEKLREWGEIVLKLRSEEGIKVRQPLQAVAVPQKLNSKYVTILKEELNVKEVKETKEVKNKEGWVFEEKVGLQTHISEALKREGMSKEVVRHIQRMRRDAGLNPEDKIHVVYSLPSSLRGRLREFETNISRDTNAKTLEERQIEGTHYDVTAEFNWDAKHKVKLALNKA